MLVARGTDRHLIAISPERRAVVVVTGTNGAGVQIDDEALFPLIDEVILPALG